MDRYNNVICVLKNGYSQYIQSCILFSFPRLIKNTMSYYYFLFFNNLSITVMKYILSLYSTIVALYVKKKKSALYVRKYQAQKYISSYTQSMCYTVRNYFKDLQISKSKNFSYSKTKKKIIQIGFKEISKIHYTYIKAFSIHILYMPLRKGLLYIAIRNYDF